MMTTAETVVVACEASIAMLREVAADAREAAARVSGEPVATEALDGIAQAASECEVIWARLRDKWAARAREADHG